MGTIIRRILAGLLATALVWCALVFWWRASGASPGPAELVVGLVLLPTGLIAGYWRLRWLRDRARGDGAPSPAPVAAPGVPERDTAVPDRVMHMFASALQLPAGASAAAVAAALAEPRRPGLHPRLRDAAGLPVFAAWVPELDTGSVVDAVQAVLPPGRRVGRVLDEEQRRALALLDPVADDLLFAASPAFEESEGTAAISGVGPAHAGMHPHAMSHSRSARAALPKAPAPVLRIHVLVPAAWSASLQQVLADWLLVKATAVGFSAERVEVEALPVAGAAEVWAWLERLAQGGDPHPHLVLACQSLIGEASIERLEARSQLLGSGHEEGLIPGEAAAGLLLAGALPPGGGAPTLRLHRTLHQNTRHGAHPRAAARHLAGLLENALATAAHPAGRIASVLSDADHRPSRAAELAGAVAEALPDLDPVRDSLCLGVACGDLGPVGPLALLATAAAQAGQRQAPVLAVSVADPRARAVLVLSPALPATDKPSAPESPEPVVAGTA